MRGFGLLFLLLAFAGPAQAGPAAAFNAASAPGFDVALTRQVYTAALTFITPRALEAVNVPELTVWGLRGLTALDPDLTAVLRSGRLELSGRAGVFYAAPAPRDEAPAAWADAATAMAAAAWNASPAVRSAGTEGVIQAFFDEMFNHLDPYSRYDAPAAAAADEAARGGDVGIGLRPIRKGAAILAGTVTPVGPAARAGVRPGDALLTVDGQSTARRSVGAVAAQLAGAEGSAVVLRWLPPGGPARSTAIVRARVPPRTVFSDRLAGMLLIRITRFNRETATGFAAPIEQAMAGRNPPDGIVLDLRGNPGGLLGQAVTVADGLLPAGVVARTEGRDPLASQVWRSKSGELAPGIPVVVLVDGRTASAAEILAAALADRGRAVVVGSATFGKGLVQTFTRLPGGGELFVTWSRVLAPRGWPLQGLGVLPQVCTSLGQHAVERQLEALNDGTQPMAAAILRERTVRAPVPPAEAVAIRNACPAAVGQELDLEVAHFLIDNPAAYAAALLPPLREPLVGRMTGPP
ncbi:MAG: peptidase S41 [Proteobacteria bacterium]|nr:peptidase S41 [Pseudomonadota bacterium]